MLKNHRIAITSANVKAEVGHILPGIVFVLAGVSERNQASNRSGNAQHDRKCQPDSGRINRETKQRLSQAPPASHNITMGSLPTGLVMHIAQFDGD